MVYLALSKTTYLCKFVANKVIDPTRQYFYISDSLPAVKSNIDFGKITLMALEKYSLEIKENLVYLCFGLV